MIHWLCLIDCELHGEACSRGDIILRESGDNPPPVAFANFQPPAGLSGVPELQSISEQGSLVLFTYHVSGERFCLSGQVGIPQAHVVSGDSTPPAESSHPAAPRDFAFGAGAAVTASRGYVGWGPCLPEPPREPAEVDWLRTGGLE
jgi:hypothetical protein